MRKILTFITAVFIILPIVASQPTQTNAQAGDGWDLIAEVNALRAAYGLPPYEVNNALMASAQGHSNYQAEIGTWTHTGVGGSRPHDRAVAAGYGGGAQVYVSENIAAGVNLSPSRAVNEMWQDAAHLETMISPFFTHIGAGVGRAGDWVYYTINVGYLAGAPGSGASSANSAAPGSSAVTPAPTAIPIEPISIATPGSDGSVVHVVKYGQFLETIANAYEVPLQDVLAMNGLSDQAVIFPGDKLLIMVGQTPESTPAEESLLIPAEADLNTPIPTNTQIARPPTRTPSPVPVAMNLPTGSSPTSTATKGVSQPSQEVESGLDYLLYVVFGLAISGTALILFGNALKKRT
jgi:LysM repeat protein